MSQPFVSDAAGQSEIAQLSARVALLEQQVAYLANHLGLTGPQQGQTSERLVVNGVVLSQAAIDAIRSGRKIEAIKIVRQETGLGLAEAKSLVDELERR